MSCPVCGIELLGQDWHEDYLLVESSWRCSKAHYATEWSYGAGFEVYGDELNDSETLKVGNHYSDSREVCEAREAVVKAFIALIKAREAKRNPGIVTSGEDQCASLASITPKET